MAPVAATPNPEEPRPMKTIVRGLVASLLAVPFALGATTGVAEEAKAPPSRTFAFTYEITVAKPEAAQRLDVWIPLPAEDDLQKVEGLAVTAKMGDKELGVTQGKDETYGNRMAYVGVDAPTADVVFRWTATITRAGDVGQGKGPVLDRFKQEDRLVPLTGKAAELAKQLGVESGADVRARGRTIYDHVLTTMQYDKVAEGWGKGDFARACEVGKGNCTDFHAKFIGIGRAAGIPVRFTMGIPMTPEAKGKAGGYHCWAHFYDGTSWIPVDISEAQKVVAKDPAKAQWFFGHLDADRISLTVGRDLTLSPKQKGDPLLFFAYPYVEVDGKVGADVKDKRSFTWEAK